MKAVIHHTVTGHNVSTERIKNFGYNFVIRWNGSIIKARGNAHTYGHNDLIGISLVGNFEKEQPNGRQLEALVKLLRELKVDKVVGHRDFANNPPGRNITACPGRNLYRKLKYINQQINVKTMNEIKELRGRVKHLKKLRNKWRSEARLRGLRLKS